MTSTQDFLQDKSILITGGTGSFGNCLVRSLLAENRAKRIIIFSRDEDKQYQMSQALRADPNFGKLRFFIGDVRDSDRLEMAMRGVDCVVHAAALKHVPIAEYNPFECVRTNIYGAENVVKAAIRCGVDRVIALSTDKAANPLNLYGATKLASDKIFVAANNLSGGATRFSVVRYGNVFGSRGSAVEFFARMLAAGSSELPITHPEMTRFWISVDAGVNFVLSSLSLMQGGEIFVPKIPSAKITTIASVMAPACNQKVVGIRPGEKLHEIMITRDDARLTLDYSDRYVIQPLFNVWNSGYYLERGAIPVPDNFSYSSDNNSEWLSEESIREMLRKYFN